MFITIYVKVNYIFNATEYLFRIKATTIQGVPVKSIRSLFAISTLMTLAACGGGGSSTTPSTTTTYPLRSGYQNLISQSEVNSFSISGTCTGTATETRSAAVPATFEGTAGVSTTATVSISLSNCTPASSAGTSIGYYDTNYKPLGIVMPGSEYAVYSISNLPVSAKVGDTAQLGTADVYSSSTKQVKTGTRILSYAIEADSDSSAIINLIAKAYNTSNQLLYTQQSRYRINTSGQLTAVSTDIQYSTNSTLHVVMTRN
jgi:hypothetical protein